MTWLLPYLLFIHIWGAIFAFGPTFAFGIYAKSASDPSQQQWNGRARALVSQRMTVPGTFVVLLTGVAMIAVLPGSWIAPQLRWLHVSIVLYVGAILYSAFVTGAAQRELGRLARAQPADPMRRAALVTRVRRDGKAMGVIVVIILFLMVVKPTFPL